MLDNECLVRYLLSIEQKKVFQIENMKFENNEYSLNELFKFSLYYPNINKFIDYIKSKICVKCRKIMEKGKPLLCGCYMCEGCYSFLMYFFFCPRCEEINNEFDSFFYEINDEFDESDEFNICIII
jgi:hypothetical protein